MMKGFASIVRLLMVENDFFFFLNNIQYIEMFLWIIEKKKPYYTLINYWKITYYNIHILMFSLLFFWCWNKNIAMLSWNVQNIKITKTIFFIFFNSIHANLQRKPTVKAVQKSSTVLRPARQRFIYSIQNDYTHHRELKREQKGASKSTTSRTEKRKEKRTSAKKGKASRFIWVPLRVNLALLRRRNRSSAS